MPEQGYFVLKIEHPHLYDRLYVLEMGGLRNVLLFITIAPDVALQEVDKISSEISELADQNVNLIFGLNFDENLDDEIKVLQVATHRNTIESL